MKVRFFLVVKEGGSIRTTRNRPSMASDEIAVEMNLTIPSSAFARVYEQVNVEIDPGAVIQPVVEVIGAES